MRQFPLGAIGAGSATVDALLDLFDPDGIDDVVVPAGEWILSETLDITNRSLRAAHATSTIRYVGSGPAVRISTNDTHHRVPHIIRTLAWDAADRTSIGCQVLNAYDNTIHLAGVQGFWTGLDVRGDDDGCCFNEIHPGKLVDNMLGMAWSVNGTGWVNSNTFIGGRAVLTSSAPSGVVGSRGVAGGQGTGTGERAGNGNTVIALGLESDRWQYSVELTAPYNTFTGCRFEDASPILMSGENAYGNQFIGGYAIIDDDRYGPDFLADTATGRAANVWRTADGDHIRKPVTP